MSNNTPPSDLANKKCIPCSGGVVRFPLSLVKEYLAQVPLWETDEEGRNLYRKYDFKNFAKPLAFVNKIGEIAEAEGHHPDIEFGWGYVRVRVQTHKINGLVEADFILAAKIEREF